MTDLSNGAFVNSAYVNADDSISSHFLKVVSNSFCLRVHNAFIIYVVKSCSKINSLLMCTVLITIYYNKKMFIAK